MITEAEVQKISKLARLTFDTNSKRNIVSQLNSIIDMIDILNEVDCEGIQPLISVSDMSIRFRSDEITSTDLSHEIFDNVQGSQAQLAKEVKCFITPKIVE